MPQPNTYTWSPTALRLFERPTSHLPTREKIQTNNQDTSFSDWDWKNPQRLGPDGEELPVLATGWKPDGTADFGPGLNGWVKKVASNIQQSYWKGYEEGLKISGVTEFVIKKTQGEEKGAETLETMKEKRDPKSQQMAYFTGATEATKEIFEQLMWGALDVLSYPAIVTEQGIGAAVMSIGDAAKGKTPDWERNFQASRLFYSSIFDETIRAQMNRRLDEGIRPELAAMLVMQENKWTLWPELIGQVVVDPLNLVTIWGKGKHAAKLTKTAKAGFHTVQNADVAKVLDDLAKITDDAAAARYLDDLGRAQKGLAAAEGHFAEVVKTNKALGSLENAYRASALTADGKVAHLSNQVGEIMLHITNHTKDPEDALELLRAMVKSTSDDAFERAEGLAVMLRFTDPKSLFSEAGNATTAMLGRMTTRFGETWLDDIGKALKEGGKPKLVNMLMGKLNTIGNEMYPPVVDMIKAEERVAKLTADGAEIPEALAKVAEASRGLPQTVKATAIWNQRLQKFPVGPLNRFFVGAYLGWNPGYAARNFANNALTMFVDYGPGVLLGKADDLFDDARKLHGGSELLFGAHGFGSESLVFAARRIEKERTGLKAVGETVAEGVRTLKGPSRGAAELAEVNAAKRIVAKTYKRTFQSGMKAMVKEATPALKQAGYSDNFIRRLPTLIEENYGDIDKIIKTVRAEHASGVTRLFNDVSRIDPSHRKFLEDVGKWDEYVRNVLQAPTKEEAATATEKIFADLKQVADEAYRQGTPAADHFSQFLRMAVKEGGLGEVRGQLIDIRRMENEKAVKAAEAILAEVDRAANAFMAQTGQVLDTPAMKSVHNITGLSTWGNNAAAEAHRLNDLAWKAYREAKEKGAQLDSLWTKYGEFFGDLEIPQQMTYYDFTDALWHRYYDLSGNEWMKARDLAINGVKGYLGDLKGAGVQVKDEWAAAIDAALDSAAQYDNIQIGRFGVLQAAAEAPGPYGSRASQIAQLANQYGIPTSGEGAFKPTDKKTLNLINKYAQVRYSSLEEVPLEVAEAAFAKRTGKTVLAAGKATPEVQKARKLLEVKKYTDLEDLDTQEVIKFVKEYGTPEQTQALRELESNISDLTDLPKIGAREKKAIREAGQEFIKEAKKYLDEISLTKLPGGADEAIEAAPEAARLLPPHVDGEMPTVARAIEEQMEEVHNIRDWMVDDIARNFDKTQVADQVTDKMLDALNGQFKQKIAETRLIASRVAQANRDFTLLDYSEKKYYDLAMAYLYPFGFWYKGTYSNWLKRVAMNPAILGDYARYKDILGTIHADMPEWWRYNINTNDLPGIETENPLYFNLEATLWPLNGITNVDFNDPYKRVNWWTYTLDFMNRFGPSTWSPLNMVTGLVLYQNGEKEAGERWLGRAVPQTATIKSVASLFGIGNFEIDPFVSFLMDGLDPYERRRVGRALGAMEQESIMGLSPYSREQIYDAAWNREGAIWDDAVQRAVRQRAGSNLSSFLLGVGAKARTDADMEIDKFYNDYYRLWGMEPHLRPEEFREAMEELRSKYPFMETVLISRRSGFDRDRGLAYNALARVPPGRSDDYAELVGIPGDLLSRFYDEKGHIENWSNADRDRFMAGIIDINAMLAIPGDVSRREWSAARGAYSTMLAEAEKAFGEDIWDKMDVYGGLKKQSPDLANAYLDTHPELTNALDWRSRRIIQSPLLNAYYGGAGLIENYMRSLMYDDIEKQMGTEIFDVVVYYGELKTYGTPEEIKSFYAQHKRDIKKYYGIKDEWQIKINRSIAKISNYLPEIANAEIRPDAPTGSALIEEGKPTLSAEEWGAYVNPYLMELVQEYFADGEELPYEAEKQLERIADDLGYEDADDVLQAIGASFYQNVHLEDK